MGRIRRGDGEGTSQVNDPKPQYDPLLAQHYMEEEDVELDNEDDDVAVGGGGGGAREVG